MVRALAAHHSIQGTQGKPLEYNYAGLCRLMAGVVGLESKSRPAQRMRLRINDEKEVGVSYAIQALHH